ncbi:hypothetical protein JCM3774_001600 [Rhodotorula dairenensis]
MLAAPPIYAALKRPAYPPASVSSDPAPLPSAPTPRPRQRGETHRHAQGVKDALKEAQRLADQIDEALAAVTDDTGRMNQGIGIIASLEKSGWVHHTTTSGVRIFRSAAQVAPDARLDRSRPAMSLAKSTSSHPSSRGLKADEALPYFRGEGWIEGSWRREDVAATILSLDARSVWDSKLERPRSQIIEHLSETDSLCHMHLKSTLVSDRDLCLVTSSAADDRPDRSNTTYVLSASVEDPLVPPSSSTTTIHLNAFALRSLPRPPPFEPPPLFPSPSGRSRHTNGSPPTRPGHRRTRSTASALHTTSSLLATIPLPPIPPQPDENPGSSGESARPRLVSAHTHTGHPHPPPLPHTLSNYTSATSSYGYTGSVSTSDVAGPYPPMHFLGQGAAGQLGQQKRTGPAPPVSDGPGLAVSMIIHASPGYNLPQTTVDQLSILLPLNIASIGRYLATHGFAPYLSRSCGHLHIREEAFDAQAGRYRVVFTTSAAARAQPNHQAEIRFFGGSFGRGRFQVEVHHVDPKAWTLGWDLPPRPEDESRFDLRREAEEIGGEGSGLWRSKVSLRRPGEDDRPKAERRTSSNSLFSPLERDDASARDPALQPGPLGGCTVYIPTSATQPALPVVVTVERTTTVSATLPLARRQGVSNALAQAAQVALDDHLSLCSSVEELLECGVEGTEERAEVCLKGTRLVLSTLESAQAREQVSANAASAAAAFAARKNALRSPLSRSTILLQTPVPPSRSSGPTDLASRAS